MKKLKGRLERKICNILSCLCLGCEGKKCFKISTRYQFPTPNHAVIEIEKENRTDFSYVIYLKYQRAFLARVKIVYDISRKDVPIQEAYIVKEFVADNRIPSLKNILGLLKEGLYEKNRTIFE